MAITHRALTFIPWIVKSLPILSMTGPCARSHLGLNSLPCVHRDVKGSEVAVVMKTVLIQRREFATCDDGASQPLSDFRIAGSYQLEEIEFATSGGRDDDAAC